jgi:hypothetical protein
MGRINHSKKRTATSMARTPTAVESFFSRLRRMVNWPASRRQPEVPATSYASHAAWLEDHRRRESNGTNAHATVLLAMHHAVSTTWAGYWQRANKARAAA